jgi:hypothetical protein
VLKGVDGLVFVADSMAVMREKNIVALNNLRENLAFNDIDMLTISRSSCSITKGTWPTAV